MDNYVGKRLDGRYEIQDIIGVGGMAVVYKAYDSIDDRIVAVKILKDEYLANEEFRRRFKNESKAIAILSHQNIVKVYDVSFGDRLQYIVMEYIEGITLKEYIEQQECIDWNEALYFIIQILRALQHAHDKGIVHRDIKPQNIMLLENGTIKVADFGIARFSRGETRTMTEKAIGSVHYISPEQAKGEITDEKADIYSVGVVLYEMLTGKLPFEAESAVSVALMQLQKEAEPPRSINPDIPIGFEQITLKAMQKNPRDRYQTAAEMLLDLEELKRNPNIKFDYETYFTDDEPTRYIGKIQEKTYPSSSQAKTIEPSKPIVLNTPVIEKNEDPVSDVNENSSANVISDVTDEKPKNNKTIIILACVVLGIILIAGAVIGVLMKKGTISIGGIGTQKIEVDSFIGMYYDELVNNPEYDENYNFEPVYVSFSDAEEGTVYNQDPKAGDTITKGGTVKLFIVKSGEGIIIPDFSGKSYKEVGDKLESMGFNVSFIPESAENASVGEVLRTEPAANSSVLAGSSITVFYCADSSSETLFKMPELEGKSLAEASSIIGEKGLVLSKTEIDDSTIAKDYVLVQSPSSGSPVRKGDAVILTVSSGFISGKTKINIPKTGGQLPLKVTVNDEVTENVTVDTNSVSSYEVTVKGNGNKASVKIYLDEMLYMEMTADFTKEPVKFSNVKTNQLSFYINVLGMSESDAKSSLNKAGYNNISVIYEESTYPEGVVINQSPSYSSAPHVDNSAAIVLTVSSIEQQSTQQQQPEESTEQEFHEDDTDYGEDY